jgi:hypothetical protein
MSFKMENPNKVRNIVIGSFDGLNALYLSRLKELEKIGLATQIEEEKFKVSTLYKFYNNCFTTIEWMS